MDGPPGARSRSLLQGSGRRRWCGIASWESRQLRAKGEDRIAETGGGRRGRQREVEARTEKQGSGQGRENAIILKRRKGELGKKLAKRRDSEKGQDIYLYLHHTGSQRYKQREREVQRELTGQRRTDPGAGTGGHRRPDCLRSLLLAMEAEGRSEQGKQKKGLLCSSLWPQSYPAAGTLTSTAGE